MIWSSFVALVDQCQNVRGKSIGTTFGSCAYEVHGCSLCNEMKGNRNKAESPASIADETYTNGNLVYTGTSNL